MKPTYLLQLVEIPPAPSGRWWPWNTIRRMTTLCDLEVPSEAVLPLMDARRSNYSCNGVLMPTDTPREQAEAVLREVGAVKCPPDWIDGYMAGDAARLTACIETVEALHRKCVNLEDDDGNEFSPADEYSGWAYRVLDDVLAALRTQQEQ